MPSTMKHSFITTQALVGKSRVLGGWWGKSQPTTKNKVYRKKLMTLLAIDIGTTHCKAGLFDVNGTVMKIASRKTITRQSSDGWAYYEPHEMLGVVAAIVEEVTRDQLQPIAAIGIASMAETGLLVDRKTSQYRSFMIPWFETKAQPYADEIILKIDPMDCYLKYGLRVSFKSSLAKILWLRQECCSLENAIWLSAADFVAYWLTGEFGTDYSLAGRTLVFRVGEKRWDEEWLREWKIPENLFPPAYQSGTPIGKVVVSVAGLKKGIPVSVCGHDHICASLAMGVIRPGIVFDSMGTAESMIGVLPERSLTEADYHNGLHYGCHVAEGLGYWTGGLSTSGGSVEWVRTLLSSAPSYQDLDALLDNAGPRPTGILYFPYLLGSGSPHVDPRARGALIGLTKEHRSQDFFKAVLEGTAYEMEFIRRAGERMTGQPIRSLVAAGGGTRFASWMQIKADVSGCEIKVSTEPEATLVGAAISVGVGCGVYSSLGESLNAFGARFPDTFHPIPQNFAIYKQLYENGYLHFQEALRSFKLPEMPGM